jgi:hypothetical protein
MKNILFFLVFTSSLLQSQVIKDTVLGKPKFVKEYVVFLNDSHPFTFMKGDDAYGHATIMHPKILRKSMRGSWYETDFCRYINNETYYDKNRNITKEIWYYKSGEIVDDYDYTYDHINRVITEKSKNDSSEDNYRYFYEKDSRVIKFREIYSKWKDEPMRRYVQNLESVKPLFFTKFDSISRTDSIFAITNEISKKINDSSYSKIKDSVYHKRLSRVKIYNNKFKVIEEKIFDYEGDYQNKIILNRYLKYEYDELGNITKQTDFSDGKRYSYIMFDNGKIVEQKTDGGSFTSSQVYIYTKGNMLGRETLYAGDKVWRDKKFEYTDNHISKLLYLDKFGRINQKIEPTVVIFKYKFDKQKNWTEIIKNVDGKDLYKWVREIQYYK